MGKLIPCVQVTFPPVAQAVTHPAREPRCGVLEDSSDVVVRLRFAKSRRFVIYTVIT